MKRTGSYFHVIGLQDDAALVRPVALEREDQPLERAFGAHMRGKIVAHAQAERRSASQRQDYRPGLRGSRTARRLFGTIHAGVGIACQRLTISIADRARPGGIEL